MSDLTTEIYDETANLGKIYATVQIIIGIIIFIICCLCGMYNEFSRSETSNTTATITNVNSCVENKTKTVNDSEETNYVCNLEISYIVNGTTYKNTISLKNSEKYVVNKTVDISYQVNNPNNIGLPQADNRIIGSISMIIGSLLLASFSCNYYFASNSKIYAASTGAVNTINIVKGVFK
jgi:hypothetical protein